MTRAPLLLAVAGLAAATVGVGWLAPLMLDQLVLFGSREQTEVAAASRSLMLWPLGLLALGAILGGVSGRWRNTWVSAVALAPIVAVFLAFAAPDRAWQLLAFLITAPSSIGAHLAAVRPIFLRRSSVPAVLVVLSVAALMGVLVNGAILLFSPIAIGAWAALSGPSDASNDQHT
ncbi:MAG TPA: hypothetical protein VFP30_01030 [Candidatus Limnocylindria bacterium]|nr:hypothetical protein [Candidatus Limnocylindria bacterium]